jgi:hypothetical protein
VPTRSTRIAATPVLAVVTLAVARLAVARLAVVALAVVALGGCGSDRPAGVNLPSPTRSPTPTPEPTYLPAPPLTRPPRPPTSGPTTFDERVAVPCAGRPGADQVVALLRRTPGVLTSGVTVTVRTGPLCAGTWQFTVVTVPERDPLQVVSKGAPGALTLVTAGTDVCTAPVRAGAPAGILTVARCT